MIRYDTTVRVGLYSARVEDRATGRQDDKATGRSRTGTVDNVKLAQTHDATLDVVKTS